MKTIKKKNEIKKFNKKIILIILIFLIIIILGTTLGIVYIKFHNNEKIIETEIDTEQLATELLGEQRLKEQQKIYEIVDKYIKDNDKVKDYVINNNITCLSIKDLQEIMEIDITEFKESKYKCNSEYTTIDFTEGFENYKILLSCDAFLLSK